MKSPQTKIVQQATLTDWAIVQYPEIYGEIDNPSAVYAKPDSDRTIALFGKGKNDPRANTKSDEFKDGHRLITSPIIAIEDGKFHTANTVYTLEKENINPGFKEWCGKHCEEELNKDKRQENMLLRHICENCGKEEVLTSEEGYEKGWDYPPKMGSFAVISPRTCGNCGIQTTLWWEITSNQTPLEDLNDHHKTTLERILGEPDTILP